MNKDFNHMLLNSVEINPYKDENKPYKEVSVNLEVGWSHLDLYLINTFKKGVST